MLYLRCLPSRDCIDVQSVAAHTRAKFVALVLLAFGTTQGFAQPPALPPAVQQGVDWLNAQVQSDGSLANEGSSIATPFQVRVEAIATLSFLDTTPAALADIVAMATVDDSEYLSRQIIAAAGTQRSTAADVAILRAMQNPDGGWGLTSGYESDVLDTALALQAFSAANAATSSIEANALTFLSQAKQADGGWGIDQVSSVYITSNVGFAAESWSALPNASTITSSATAWLRGHQVDGAFSDIQSNALALLALSSQTSESGDLAPLIEALSTVQGTDGSWSEDPYLTGLCLRALQSATVGSAAQGAVVGRVVDSGSAMPLASVPIALLFSGGTPVATHSAADGTFSFSRLKPGQYTIQLAVPDFVLYSRTFAVAAGEHVDLSNINLIWSTAPTGAIVRGVVVDSVAGNPISGVEISVGTLLARTDSRGRYELSGVPPGNYQLSATDNGYISGFASAILAAGDIQVFSPRLVAGTTQPSSGRIYGRVTHAIDGSPFPVRIYPTPGISFLTNADGTYSLDTPPGSYTLTIPGNWGNDWVTAYISVAGNEQVNYSPKLYDSGQSPPNANMGEALLHIVDADSGAPIAGASVRTDEYTSSWQYLSIEASDNTGLVDIEGIHSDTIRLTVAASGYSPNSLTTFARIPLDKIADLGQVGLTKLAYGLQTFPDLRVDAVDTSALTYGPTGTSISGVVGVTVGNHGEATTGGWFNLVAFLDRDGDDTFNTGDTAIGTARISPVIAPNTIVEVTIPLSGIAEFSHAPVKLFIDPEQRLNEINTWNNIGSSSQLCSFTPNLGTGEPVLKWQLTNTEIMNVPVVAPLLDTNGDGVVDELDKRAVIVVTFSGFVDNAGGTVRALDAETGQQLWEVDDPDLQARASGHVAIGDIEGDGKPEVIYYRSPDNHVVVLDNQGYLKWTAPYPEYSGGYNYRGPAISDLDGDGNPAVLVPGAALNSDGSVRFTYPITNLSTAPEAIDLNLTGRQDVIVGNRAFDSSGNLLWTASVPDLFSGAPTRIGAVRHPVIFTANTTSAYAVSSTGEQLWNVVIPYAYGVPPVTVGDTLGNGAPGIGFVTYNQYVVLRGDGAVLWSADMGDDSGGTAAVMFDFSGSGHMDVVYANLTELRVMDGRDGHTIYSLPHGSDTAGEYPVVADIDRSGHASLLVVGDLAPNQGLSVYGPPADGQWPGARAIWNQYAYSMNNVNDDGSIPANPGHSWLEHNSFRANVVHFPNALADLVVDGVTIVDNGYGHSPTIDFRVGNAGLRAPPRETFVDVYNGDPNSGGVPIGHDRLRLIPAGTSTSFSVSNVSVATGDTLFVYADQANSIEECGTTNNTAIVTVSPANALANVQVATDQNTYAPGATLTATAIMQNIGALSNDFQVHLWVSDMQGGIVTELGTQAVTALAGNDSQTVSATWTVENVIAGPYQLQGAVLPGAGGSSVAQASSPFSISAQGASAALRVATTKATYATTQPPEITFTLVNVSTNAIWDDAHVQIQVFDAGSNQVFDHDFRIGQLTPGNVREGNTQGLSTPLPPGTYSVTGAVRDGQNGTPFATSMAIFTVIANTGTLLQGTATASQTQILIHDSVACGVTIRNQGPDTVTDQPVRFGIRGLSDGVLNGESHAIITLAANETWNQTLALDASTLGIGPHACVVEAQINGNWTTLAHANFGIYFSTDLQTQLAARSPNLSSGQTQYYSVRVINAGPDTSAGARLSLILPPQMSWLGAGLPSPGCMANGSQITCPLPVLNSGQSVELCVATRVSIGTPMVVSTDATSSVDTVTALDGNPANNAVSITTNIVPELLYADGYDPCWFQTDVIFIDGFGW